MRQLAGDRPVIRTYVFDADEWESVYGMAIRQDFYLLHFFDDDVCLGAIQYNGCFTLAFETLTRAELEARYWICFE